MLLPLLIFDNELTEIYLTLTYKNEQTTADEIVTDKYITESTRVRFDVNDMQFIIIIIVIIMERVYFFWRHIVTLFYRTH